MQWPKVFRNLGIWPTFFHPFWTIFCQGESWDHFLGRWRVKIHKFNDFWWLLQQIRIFVDLSWGWRRVEKNQKKKDIGCSIPKAATMCALLCAGCRCLQNHGFWKIADFSILSDPKHLFLYSKGNNYVCGCVCWLSLSPKPWFLKKIIFVTILGSQKTMFAQN